MRSILSMALCCLLTTVLGAESPGASLLAQGQDAYAKGNYLDALTQFQRLVSDPQTRTRPEPYLWLAKTYFAVLDTKNASQNLDYYLANFPQDPGRAEALYLQARILYSDGDYAHAIQAFGQYLDTSPTGDQVPNSLFWMAESAFALGHYEEAASLYTKIVQGYPSSFKWEASRYRLSVIDLKHREDELLKLLQWSHAESINSEEDFQRRERVYQQSLAAYQKKLLEMQSTDSGARVAALEESIRQKDLQIAALKSQAPVASPLSDQTDKAQTVKLLELKVRALSLQNALLQWRLSHAQ